MFARIARQSVSKARASFSSSAHPKPSHLQAFTEEELMIKESVASFASKIVAPKVREMDEKEMMDKDVLKALFDQGIMGLDVPAEYDGSGASYMSLLLAVEEISKIDPAVGTTADVHALIGAMLIKYGTESQKQKYLVPHTTSKLGSFCLSEAGSGSDAFALQARAVKDGDHYILNGSKMWITNSFEAETFLVFATVDPSLGYKGITCFIVEKDMGIQIAKKEKKLGIRASSTCVISLDDVRVPAENILGEIGKGYQYAIGILNEGRIGIAAQMIGLAQGAVDYAVPYTFQRKQFGQFIGDFQGMQFQLAQVQTEIEAARLVTYNAARMKENGENFIMQAAMAKLYAGQVAKKASAMALEWTGGVGFTRDLPLEKFYRDAMVGQIYEGTSNIQLMTIAKMLRPKYA